MKTRKSNISVLVPVISIVTLFIVFAVASGGKLVSQGNIVAILDQTIPVIVGALGVIFVIAQGSLDLSIGSTIGLAGVIGAMAAQNIGTWALIPTTILVGLGVGLLNGVIVSKLKVSSFMVTLAMLIGLKGVTNYLLSFGVMYLPTELMAINSYPIKIPILIGLLVLMYFLFEYTRLGRYSQSIGENETAVRFVGIPVERMKIAVFVISGLMAGVCGFLTLARLGGPTNSMGSFYEMKVMMAIFLGGVLVTGGTQTRIYKMLIGAFTITIIENGLILCGVSSEISEAVQGILLILILFFTTYLSNRPERQLKRSEE